MKKLLINFKKGESMPQRQKKRFPEEFRMMLLLLTPFLLLLVVWALAMALFLRRPSPPLRNSTIQTPQTTDIETLQDKVEQLQAQIDQLQETDSRAFDLVIASLGSLVAVAVILPAAATVSKAISDQNERNQVKSDIRDELKEEVGAISEHLLLHNYELLKFIANEVHIEDIKRIMEISNQDKLTDPNVKTRIESKLEYLLRQRKSNDLLQSLEIHKYPLVLQDMSRVFCMHSNLGSSNPFQAERFIPFLEKQLSNFLLLLIVMTCRNDMESDETYIFPRLTSKQIDHFETLFYEMGDYLRERENVDYILQMINKINEILSDKDAINRQFNFTKTLA